MPGQPPYDDEELVSRKDLAEWADVKVRTVRRWVAEHGAEETTLPNQGHTLFMTVAEARRLAAKVGKELPEREAYSDVDVGLLLEQVEELKVRLREETDRANSNGLEAATLRAELETLRNERQFGRLPVSRNVDRA